MNNVIDMLTPEQKAQRDRLRRQAQWKVDNADRLAAEKKERREHRAELKASKPKRDAEKLLQHEFEVAKHALFVAAANGEEFLQLKAEQEGKPYNDYLNNMIKIMEAQLPAAEKAAALMCGFENYADLIHALADEYKDEGEAEAEAVA